MQSFDIIKQSKVGSSFRCESVKGKFDLHCDTVTERFTGEIDLSNDKWNVGVIVGPSGSGKTTIARQLFPGAIDASFAYISESVVDDMPDSICIDEIVKIFNSVGFSSPPSWLKPYSVLSNGEKMRVDLARCLLEEREISVFDEFTSVVDRTVAKIGSAAMSKAIRRNDKKFIAVTCHYDVLEWLEPDWIFDTKSMTFSKKTLQTRHYHYNQAMQSRAMEYV